MYFHGKKSAGPIPFVVRYLPAPRLRQAGLTTNGTSDTYGRKSPFSVIPANPGPRSGIRRNDEKRRYWTFYELIKSEGFFPKRETTSQLFYPDKPGFLSAVCSGLDKLHLEPCISEDLDDFLFAPPAGVHSFKQESTLLDKTK